MYPSQFCHLITGWICCAVQERAEVATAFCRLLVSRQNLEAASSLAVAETPALLEAGVQADAVQSLLLCILAAAGSAGDWQSASAASRLCVQCRTLSSEAAAARFAVYAATANLQQDPGKASISFRFPEENCQTQMSVQIERTSHHRTIRLVLAWTAVGTPKYWLLLPNAVHRRQPKQRQRLHICVPGPWSFVQSS